MYLMNKIFFGDKPRIYWLVGNMVNFNQLRAFYYTAKFQSCTKAAEKLFITQPAVTAQLKALEEYCDLKLFKKKGRNIFLTDEGKALFEHARKIFEWEREIEALIEDMRELKIGVLRLGSTKTYARYVMPSIIGRFHESYPQIKILLDEGSSLDLVHSLLDLRNEVVIIAKVEDNPRVQFTPFSCEELILILPPGHELAAQDQVSIKDLHGTPLIMKERGSGTRKLVNELFASFGIKPNVLMETSNTELLKQMVSRGDGVAFVVKGAVEGELASGGLVTVPLDCGPILLDVSIAHLRAERLSRAAQAFLSMIMEIADPRVQGKENTLTLMDRVLCLWK